MTLVNVDNLWPVIIYIFISSVYSSSSSDFAMQRFDRDSEVYKMIQENKESRTAPRQSNTFKMLQEVLEADEKG